MADELTIGISVNYTKNAVVHNITTSGATLKFDVTGDAMVRSIISVGTGAAGEALVLGDVTTPRFAWFHNLDADNFIEIGFDDSGFVPFLHLPKGASMTCWLGVAAPYAKADTAACLLEYAIIDA